VIGNDDLAEQVVVINMPVTPLIDRNGNIAVSHADVVDKNNFEAKIRSLFDEASIMCVSIRCISQNPSTPQFGRREPLAVLKTSPDGADIV
jgi:hypothetical protein